MNISRRSLLASFGVGGFAGLRRPAPLRATSAAEASAEPVTLPAIDAERIARRVVESLQPSPGERAILVYDPLYYPQIAGAIQGGLRAAGANPVLALAFDPPAIVRAEAAGSIPAEGIEETRGPRRQGPGETVSDREADRAGEPRRGRHRADGAAPVANDHEGRAGRERPAHREFRSADRHHGKWTRERGRGQRVERERGRPRQVLADHPAAVADLEDIRVSLERTRPSLPHSNRRRCRSDGDVDQRRGAGLHLGIAVATLRHRQALALGWNSRYMRFSAADGKWV